jgi:hypothetical protein
MNSLVGSVSTGASSLGGGTLSLSLLLLLLLSLSRTGLLDLSDMITEYELEIE